MMRLLLVVLVGLCISLTGCVTGSQKGTMAGAKQVPVSFHKTVKVEHELEYLLYTPRGYGSGEDFPLLIFLHGSGERGTDINKVKVHGPPKLVEEGKEFPFIVVSPQCPPDQRWNVATLDAWLDDLVKRYDVDQSRVYLTGLSMGGYGTWSWATEHADRFAAIAPICGGGNAGQASRALRDKPVWVFHGAKDEAVPLDESEQIVNRLKQRGSTMVKFTVYPDAGHDSWTETYNNPELYKWFLNYTN